MRQAVKAPVTRALLITNLGIHIFLILCVLLVENPLEFRDWVYSNFGLVPWSFWNEQKVWQPLTSFFMHGFLEIVVDARLSGGDAGQILFQIPLAFLHVGINMLVLSNLGKILETTMGSARFTWLYFISGAGASLLVMIWNHDATIPTVGASGPIAGVLGALAIFYPNARALFLFFIPMRIRTMVILFGVASLIFMIRDILPMMSHAGHLGGLLAGVLYSRFALRLEIFKEQLKNHGPAGANIYDHPRGREEVTRFMDQIMGRGNKGSDTQGFSEGSGRQGPVIEIQAQEVPESSSPASSPPSPSGGEPPASAPPPAGAEGGRKKLQFDPTTGRFFFK